MSDFVPDKTQRHLPRIKSDLDAAGFDDAEEIARGGFGVVYRCRQAHLDRTVAVKVLTSDLDQANCDRFLREQRIMGRLTGHPNIVNVLEAGVTDAGRPFIVMPYLPQSSLESHIRRDGPLPWTAVISLGISMASALETAHQSGILHRDVKPGNILFTDYGGQQLTDFGIAHLTGGFETGAGTLTGSPAFTAPEILLGKPASIAADIYSLGATLFCALTGHAPFERHSGEKVIAQFVRITTDPIPRLAGLGIPDDVCAAVERSMSANPADRPKTAAELGIALQHAQRQHGYPVDEMALNTAHPEHPEHTGHTPPTEEPIADSAARIQPRFTVAEAPSPSNIKPTPPAFGNVPGNLSVELTSFVGRRQELAAARKLLTSARLLTLTGIGGVGKSRLARRIATDIRRVFDDAVWLVELGDLHDPDLLAEILATSLHLRTDTGLPVEHILIQHLASRRLLLVLDNCEQIITAVARLTETLLRACPDLRILATSREPIGIQGEVALRVPPLGIPDADKEPPLRGLPQYDAVQLFADRATAAVPTFEVSDDNRVTVTRICQRLDGLPLPIELAAVRLRAMSAEQILARLTDRYQLLTSGGRTAPTRQQTLRLCIDWSYDLCTPQERTLWSRLSVFAGSFELDAAEAICGRDFSPQLLLDLVSSLVDKSILIREDAGTVVRYRLLDTLREYGRGKLDAQTDLEELRRQHCEWYSQLATQAEAEWLSSHQATWIARLDREQTNLRDMLEFCLSDAADTSGVEMDRSTGLRTAATLSVFWLARGQFSEGERWLTRLLSQPTPGPSHERAAALYSTSMFAAAQGLIPAAQDRLAELRLFADELNSPALRTLSTHAAGYLALYSGRPADAIGDFEDAVTSFEQEGNLLRQVGSLIGLALACGLTGDESRAVRCHERIIAITEPLGESIYRSYSRWACGLAVWLQGDPERAVQLLQQGLRLTRLVDDPRGSAWCLQTLAWIAAERRDARRAAVLLGAAETLWQAMGSPTMQFPNLRRYQKECERRVQAMLGGRGFEAESARGRSLKSDEAIAFALDEKAEQPARDNDPGVSLTRRELQVARLVAEGMTNRAIADRLVISPRTAQGHVEHVLVKLGFTSRAQIAAWIVEREPTPRP
ncbi:protein kinase [Rhodococcus sp. NPDC059968]|uniref:protein kinase domain-containing protein n=1 Tax=Rhodococcus sp. NPDC059968 TaxID=3347017 RepID=UPI00367049CD